MVLESVCVAEQLMASVLVFSKVVGAVECLGGDTIHHQLAKILTQTGTQVQELGGRILRAETGEERVIARMERES